MKMSYDGTLAMPSSYAMMDEEEMSYVEGGISLPTYATGVALDLVIAAIVSGVTGGATAFFKGLVSQYGAEKAALHFGTMAAQYAAKHFAASVATAVCGVATVAFNVILYVTNPGMALAEYWATHDNNPDTTDTIEL